jgi:hypothetical protein
MYQTVDSWNEMIMNGKPTGVVELVVAYFKIMFYARPQKIIVSINI